jgi:hypothetical protein
LGQILKNFGRLAPPPPPPVQAIVQFAGGGDGGLKTVTVATTGAVPGLARFEEGIITVIVCGAVMVGFASVVRVPPALH